MSSTLYVRRLCCLINLKGVIIRPMKLKNILTSTLAAVRESLTVSVANISKLQSRKCKMDMVYQYNYTIHLDGDQIKSVIPVNIDQDKRQILVSICLKLLNFCAECSSTSWIPMNFEPAKALRRKNNPYELNPSQLQ